MKNLIRISLFLIITQSYSQNYKELRQNIQFEKDSIYGTLLVPEEIDNPALVIFISGSGPTDMDGNQRGMKNNSVKYLAEGLSKKGIATYRFDKTVLSLMKKPGFKESDVKFSQLITAANKVGQFFKDQKAFSKIIIAGHSQGSLVGMLVAQNFADGYISLAGAGQSIDLVLKEQLLKQAPSLEESFVKTLTKLKNGEKDLEPSPLLIALFRPAIQDFLIEWIQYNPQEEIKKLKMPILIINGTNDVQVPIKEAKLLHQAATNSQLELIENMNHIFKEIKGNIVENQFSYTNPDLPVMPKLIDVMAIFVKK